MRTLIGFKRVVFAAVAAMGVSAFGSELAEGGTESTVGGDALHVFSESGTLTVKKPVYARILVVGGGGAGGGVIGGGGGGGAVITNTVVLQPGSYAVVVGAGGKVAANDSWYAGPNGEESSFDADGTLAMVAAGGGGGGGWFAAAGLAGACGGGGSNNTKGGAGLIVGADGGMGGNNSAGGGGGGASGEAGGNGGGTAGAGGAGVWSDITGDNLDYGSGGSGGCGNSGTVTAEPGGPGAGKGAEKNSGLRGGNAVDGRGGGGGGGSYDPARSGGNGGDGCVIVRYYATDVETTLRIASNAAEVSAPTPAYGEIKGLSVGDTRTCTVDKTVVMTDGDTRRWTLTGWELQSLGADGQVKGVIRSSAEGALEGESFNKCLYEHAGFARLVWQWDMEFALCVEDSVITSDGRAEFTVTADVKGLGLDGQTEGRIYVAWGQSPDRLTETNLVATVTKLGIASGTVSAGLVPNLRHYAKVFIVAGEDVAEDQHGVLVVDLRQEQLTRLPNGYQELEYIESDQTQTIKTGVSAGTDADHDTEVDITFATRIYHEGTTPLGSTAGWVGNSYLIALQSGKVQWYGGGEVLAAHQENTTYRVRTIAETKTVQLFDDDGKLMTTLSNQNFAGGELTLFSAGNGNRAQVRLMGCKIWKKGELKRDYVPARRLADGKVGLYDVAGSGFCVSEVGNAFLAGADVIDPTHALEIVGTPENFGTVKPDYGVLQNLLPGDAFTCFGGEPIATGGSQASCTGWTLYTSDGVEIGHGDGNRMSYVHPSDSGAKLVWQWETQYRVTLTAAEGGAVAFADGSQDKWFSVGSVQTVEATPADGWSFAYWTGDVPKAQAVDNPLDLTVVGAANLEAHFVRGTANVWKGGAAGGAASEPANWAGGQLPKTGETVLLTSATAEQPLVWDLKDVVPGAWLQLDGYTNAVTIATTFADGENDFPIFRVSGDVRIEDGCWTHCANPKPAVKGEAVYRLRASVGGNLTVGPKGRIEATGKGIVAGWGRGYVQKPGFGVGGTYGGRGKNAEASCYGSVKRPSDVGAGGDLGDHSQTCGGGCVMLEVAGLATIDGEVSANGGMWSSGIDGDTSKAFGTSGGTVSIIAAKITGAGAVRADAGHLWFTPWDYHAPGGGGRVALVQTAANATYADLPGEVTAYSSFSVEPDSAGRLIRKNPGSLAAGAGTVYYEVPEDEGRGKLIVKDAFDLDFNGSSTFVTDFNGESMDQDLDFGEIELGAGGTIRILPGCSITNLAETAFSGNGRVIVETDLQLGEEYDWGACQLYVYSDYNVYGSEETTFGGKVTYAGAVHVPGDLVLSAGAKVTQRAGGTDANRYRVEMNIEGNLTIDAGASIDVTGCGYPTSTGPNFGEGKGTAAYGGRTFGPSYGGDGVNAEFGAGAYPMGYGSVFEPYVYGAASDYKPGGGIVRILAGGALTVNGAIIADGGINVNSYCSGSGGSIWITAARLAGAGTIRANGGDVSGYHPGGAGGRIALYLTEKGAAFDAFDGAIAAYASIDTYTKHPVSANCGTIYEQTAGEDFGCGTVIVRNDPSSRVDKGTTTLPVDGTTAAELKKAKLVVGAATRLNLAGDFTFKDLTIDADSAKLDLMEHQLIVKSPWHAYPQSAVLNAGEWIDGKKPGYANIKWRTPGMAIMIR